jgi:hypothetical protein
VFQVLLTTLQHFMAVAVADVEQVQALLALVVVVAEQQQLQAMWAHLQQQTLAAEQAGLVVYQLQAMD